MRGPDRLAEHLLAAALTLLFVAGLALLMRRGWRRRAGRHPDLPPPAAPPVPLPSALAPAAAGLFVGTVLTTGWLERVTAHRLSSRARATLTVTDAGLLLALPRGDVWIAAGNLQQVRADAALAGKVVGPGGLLVVRWRLGDRELDSGVRLDDRARTRELVDLAAGLVPTAAPAPSAERGMPR